MNLFKKINRLSNKYIQSFTLALLALFISVAFSYLYILNNFNNKLYQNQKFSGYIAKLDNIDNSIDLFSNNKLTFVNYDEIENRIKNFYKIINKLDNNTFYNMYDSDKSKNLKKMMENLKRRFSKKVDVLERFKSYNTSVVGSLSYILELNQQIRKNVNISDKDSRMIDLPVYNILRIFLNFHLSKKEIQKDLAGLEHISKKYKKNDDLRYLVYNTKIVLKNIYIIDTLIKKLHKIDTKDIIKKIIYITNKAELESIKSLKTKTLYLLYLTILTFILFLLSYLKSSREHNQLKIFRYAVENSDNAIVVTDKNRHITYVNEAFTKNTGYTKEEALGKNPNILKSGLLPDRFYHEMNTLLDKGKKWAGEFINKTKSGKIYYEKASITPMIKRGKILGYLAIKLNITEYIEQEKRLAYYAYHDQLTGLKNRRALKEEMRALVEQNQNFFLIFLDLDGFKIVNDTLGHDIGDNLLKIVADILRHNISSNDTACRLGGDEFAIIVKNCDINCIYKIIDRILKNTSKKVKIGDIAVQISTSMGVVKYPDEGTSVKELLKNADIAMYKSKMEGKNRYNFFNPSFSKEVENKMGIERELKLAIEKGEFYLVYQPKYDIKTKKVFSVESLLRWENEVFGNVPPDYFIPIAEQAGIINDIGLYVFKKSCEDFQEIKASYPEIQLVSINVAAQQFSDKSLFDKFKDIINDVGIKPSNIGIEITETSFINNTKSTKECLNNLKQLGCKIIIDDFGTGYSSINYLKKFPIDILKIDKSFVDEITSDIEEAKTVEAIILISKVFNLKTVAEGIENKTQEEILLKMGVDLGQGYLFCKPKRKDEIIEFLKGKA